MKKNILILILLCCTFVVNAQSIPEPIKGRMVNDFANVLTQSEEAGLEEQLRIFNDSTSTQIAVVTVKSLDGMDISQYATELAHKWGVGTDGKDNGIVILFKPKTADSKGQVFIAVGYGLEGAVPDATAKMIVEKEMIPYFKQDKIAGGISQAVNTIFSLVKGEYSADSYNKKSSLDASNIFYLIIVVFIIISLIMPGRKKSDTLTKDGESTSSAILPWILLSMLAGGRGGHSGGGGFGGGGGSSFGGFGGGGFGGGGSGGSW